MSQPNQYKSAQAETAETDGVRHVLWQYIAAIEVELSSLSVDTQSMPVPSEFSNCDHAAAVYRAAVQAMTDNGFSVIEFDDSTADGYLLSRSMDGAAKPGGRMFVRATLSDVLKVGTLIHEYAHQRLHVGRYERGLDTWAAFECQAEGVSTLVCAALGVQPLSAAGLFNMLEEWGGRDVVLAHVREQAALIVELGADVLNEPWAAVGGQPE